MTEKGTEAIAKQLARLTVRRRVLCCLCRGSLELFLCAFRMFDFSIVICVADDCVVCSGHAVEAHEGRAQGLGGQARQHP